MDSASGNSNGSRRVYREIARDSRQSLQLHRQSLSRSRLPLSCCAWHTSRTIDRSHAVHRHETQGFLPWPIRASASSRTWIHGIVCAVPASISAARRSISRAHSSENGASASAGTESQSASINLSRSCSGSPCAASNTASNSLVMIGPHHFHCPRKSLPEQGQPLPLPPQHPIQRV